eukprot:TRINITY_DN824_c0_g1_i2.p1 TRINITY_DN824_c0_g1~~TRINITY_DN824_c0_g1_i2.p1  ORF type:complete len:124 (-),score=0.06 TRINITY_DN824_c0_g1_i2:82-453(-)
MYKRYPPRQQQQKRDPLLIFSNTKKVSQLTISNIQNALYVPYSSLNFEAGEWSQKSIDYIRTNHAEEWEQFQKNKFSFRYLLRIGIKYLLSSHHCIAMTHETKQLKRPTDIMKQFQPLFQCLF